MEGLLKRKNNMILGLLVAFMVNYKNKFTLDLKFVRLSYYEIFIRFAQTRLRFSSNRRQQSGSFKTVLRLTPDDLQVETTGTRPLGPIRNRDPARPGSLTPTP